MADNLEAGPAEFGLQDMDSCQGEARRAHCLSGRHARALQGRPTGGAGHGLLGTVLTCLGGQWSGGPSCLSSPSLSHS